MKKIVYVFLIVSVLTNFYFVKGCISAEKKIVILRGELDAQKKMYNSYMKEYQEKLDVKTQEAIVLSKKIDGLMEDVKTINDRYLKAEKNATELKKKFVETGKVEDCVKLVNSLEINLSIALEENATLKAVLTLKDDKIKNLEDVIALHIETIEKQKLVIDNDQMIIGKLFKETKKKVSLPKTLIKVGSVALAFIAGLLIGG